MWFPFTSFSLCPCLPPPMPHLIFLECTVPLLSVSIVKHVPWAVTETLTGIHLACVSNMFSHVEFHPSVEIYYCMSKWALQSYCLSSPTCYFSGLWHILLRLFFWEELQIWLIRRYSELPGRLCFLVAIALSIELIVSKNLDFRVAFFTIQYLEILYNVPPF